ncbi:MAG: UDP-N-acetylglucosamine 2-epimerase (non-hydrolyzing) [Candidatus Verstraetearchaeota archaeon]|nr:UDP-N-acetylglucosamine 2-epimerase (non-hydrolyzing) [Candidatus Verstraetearchaeota archaeon]
MKVAIVLGTRPEIIKMSPIIRGLEERGMEFFILHTGQHYSYNLDQVFFEQLKLPQPKYNLRVGSGTHAEETGKMMIGIERVLFDEKPDIVLVEGDTNTVLAGALASVKVGVTLGHVEAGLRSFDRSMPEEINRIVADHVSDILFAPTEVAKRNLLREGIPEEKIHVTGNTIVDAVYQNLKLAETINVQFADDDYFLVTVHRQENTDNPMRLRNIIEGLKLVKEYFNTPIIYPIHPRTLKRIKEYGIDVEGLNLIEPLDYLSFLKLESKAKLIFTDSGGVQEEACILRVPCVTLRYNTERPETLEVGANVLAGTEPKEILEKAKIMINAKRDWENPFGDGRAANRIINIISRGEYRQFK